MITVDLQEVADAVVRRAQRQGSITPRDVQDELKRAGLEDGRLPDVLSLCRRSLRRREGQYHYLPAGQAERQAAVRRLVRALIRQHKKAQAAERREQERVDFIQPVRVLAEDGQEMRLLSRDLSTTGIRLLGTRSLLGQKLRVLLGQGAGACSLDVRVLWTCAVGDGLFENGGMFLEGESAAPARGRVSVRGGSRGC